MELCLGSGKEPTESFWVSIKERRGTGDIKTGVCYRPPEQEEQADEALYRQRGAASCLQALVFMGDFHHPDICRRNNTKGHKQSHRVLQYFNDDVLLQVIRVANKERCSAGPHTHQARRGPLEMQKFNTASAAVTMRWWSSGS